MKKKAYMTPRCIVLPIHIPQLMVGSVNPPETPEIDYGDDDNGKGIGD